MIWIIARSKWWLTSLVVLLAGFQQIKACFAFNFPQKFESAKKENTLRIVQWNVEGWGDYQNTYDSSNLSNMKKVIANEDPDVLCVEEYFDFLYPRFFKPVKKSITALGYPYQYIVPSEYYKDDNESGIAIFSKYPIIDSGKYKFDQGSMSEHLLFADIKVNDKTFRIFATHLQSVHFHAKDYQSLTDIKHGRSEGLSDSRTIVSKMKHGYISRYKQAELVNNKLRESPYPAFICGDFNDVPNSSTYFKIKGNFKDAFLQKGTFIGRTFRYISPTLRIDYILADKRFTVSQFQRLKVTYSDHYPIEADLSY